MRIKINKQLILEDYTQYFMDHYSDNNEINTKTWDNIVKAGTPIKHYIENEKILDEIPETKSIKLNTVIPEKYPYFDNDSVEIIRKGINADLDGPNAKNFQTSKVSLPTAVKNSHDFMVRLGEIENSGKLQGANNKTSAKGLYQFTDSTVKTDIKRGIRDGTLSPYTMNWVERAQQNNNEINPNELSVKEATNLGLAHQIGHGNGKRYFHFIPEGNLEKQHIYNYMNIHHSDKIKNEEYYKALNRSKRFFSSALPQIKLLKS